MSGGDVPWFNPRVSSIEQGILYALSYADIYDYPLTLPQLHRYLVGIPATMAEVASVVEGSTWSRRQLVKQGPYYMLHGRESLAELRRQRTVNAHKMWIRARYFARAIADIPFVKMIALTGALTMDNVESGDDFDYLIVTEAGNLWLARFLIVQLIVKPALRKGEEVCPNYIVTERALVFDQHEQDLYHAHELTQMVPMYGEPIYSRLRAANRWTDRFLPNARGAPSAAQTLPLIAKRKNNLTEGFLDIVTGQWFERHEMSRIAKKLNAEGINDEVIIGMDQCKGHTGENRKRTREAFVTRITAFSEG
jgi:hypothetical protein